MSAEIWAGFVLGLTAGLSAGLIFGVMLGTWLIRGHDADCRMAQQEMADRVAGKYGEDKSVEVHL